MNEISSDEGRLSRKSVPVVCGNLAARNQQENMNNKLKSADTEDALRTPVGPCTVASAAMGQTARRRFRVYACGSIPTAAEVVVKASTPEEAGRLVERILQGRPFAEQLHKILEQHELRVTSQSGQQVIVRVESVLLDLPPEATVWKTTEP
jgi:hypothetical protein